MKELSIEEKAKAYDDAIAVINKSETDKYGCIIGIKPSDIFPELKESNDEKVKRILHSISSKISSNLRNIFTEEEFQCFDTWSNVWLEKQGEQEPADKVEPKFKVKYAGREYNVLEVKNIGGVTYFGIEDEPNHIDYIHPDNCEIVSEQKPAWSVEDSMFIQTLRIMITRYAKDDEERKKLVRWLDIHCNAYPIPSGLLQAWNPSDEQMKALDTVVADAKYKNDISTSGYKPYTHLYTLLQDLKKL